MTRPEAIRTGIEKQLENLDRANLDLQGLTEARMNFGLSKPTLNRASVFAHSQLDSPSFLALRGFCQTTAAWQEEMITSWGGRAGRSTVEELRRLLTYFDWVDKQYPDGVPVGTFRFSKGRRAQRVFLLSPTGEKLGFLPLLDSSLTAPLGEALKEKKGSLAAPEKAYPSWQKEIRFLNKYYGLEIEVITKEALGEENLRRLMALGQTILNAFPAGPLKNDNLKMLLERLSYFEIFDSQTLSKLPSLTTLENFVCLVLGISAELPREKTQAMIERNLGIFRQYFFKPEMTYQSLAQKYKLNYPEHGGSGILRYHQPQCLA